MCTPMNANGETATATIHVEEDEEQPIITPPVPNARPKVWKSEIPYFDPARSEDEEEEEEEEVKKPKTVNEDFFAIPNKQKVVFGFDSPSSGNAKKQKDTTELKLLTTLIEINASLVKKLRQGDKRIFQWDDRRKRYETELLELFSLLTDSQRRYEELLFRYQHVSQQFLELKFHDEGSLPIKSTSISKNTIQYRLRKQIDKSIGVFILSDTDYKTDDDMVAVCVNTFGIITMIASLQSASQKEIYPGFPIVGKALTSGHSKEMCSVLLCP